MGFLSSLFSAPPDDDVLIVVTVDGHTVVQAPTALLKAHALLKGRKEFKLEIVGGSVVFRED